MDHERMMRELWRPPPRLRLSEWADEHAVLSAESAAEPGKWKTISYQAGVMDAFTDPTAEVIVWMKSTRVGATKIFNNLVGYHVHQDPCPIMVVQPTVEDAEGYSKDEIAPMIRDTPALDGLVSEPKAKDGSNTILSKQFPGGVLGMVGANSARGFRRVSRRVVLFDEVDAYPPSTKEGDQIKLGIKRSDYYWNRKIGIASTPTTKGFSRIEEWFSRTDQRRYFVPCPHCEYRQVLRWQQLKWEKDKPETVEYECEACGERIPHTMKRWMVDHGEWRPTAEPERPGYVGFHIWAGYSFSPNSSWEQLVREFLEVKSDPEMLQTFVNTVLGETFEESYHRELEASDLMKRRESFEDGVCPDGVLLLTMGVDVQDDRLAFGVYGWGEGEHCWRITSAEIDGDPTRDEPWEQLLTIIDHEWPTAGGKALKIAQVAVDSGGHCTSEVYGFARENRQRGVMAVKGSNTRGQPVINRGRLMDVNHRGKLIKRGVQLFMIGTDTAKETLYGRMKHEEGTTSRMHFGAGADEEYFRQVTSEKVRLRYVKGFPVKEWYLPSGVRNEQLDCLVYAYAALQLVYRRHNRAKMWEQLRSRLEAQGTVKTQKPDREQKPEIITPERQIRNNRRRPVISRGGFVSGW
jgi:phage terminase large subunit GpA-like protein